MKHIIIALAIAAFACSGAEAQICKPQPAAKHVSAAPAIQQKTVELSCHLVPYEVCKINPDRKSVSCFKTVDPEGNEPLYPDEVTTYGPTGDLPGQTEKQDVETIVVKGPVKGDYCKRSEANDATICFHSGTRLTRDEEGFYHYR